MADMKKILVIDDSGLILRTIKLLLENTYDVTVAVSGQIGLVKLAEVRPDLILLDYEMPDMDGLETFTAIRNSTAGAAVPVIFLSGTDDPDTKRDLEALDCSGFISKPPKPEVLTDAITRVLSQN